MLVFGLVFNLVAAVIGLICLAFCLDRRDAMIRQLKYELQEACDELTGNCKRTREACQEAERLRRVLKDVARIAG